VASIPFGITATIMLAHHGFTHRMLADLVRAGFAIAERTIGKADGKNDWSETAPLFDRQTNGNPRRSRFHASTSGGGGREAVSSWHGIGHHLVGVGPIARLLRRRRYSTTEMGTEKTRSEPAILPSRARADFVASE
jgi:hypothetical protein